MSLILDGTNGLSDVDGSAGTPAIRGSDANTGVFFGADIIGFSEGGTECARFNADAQFVAAAGTASLPVITTTGDVNTGIFFPGADRIGFAEGGVQVGEFDASGNFLMNSGYGSAAVAYGCRAWVNFDGTGTPAIRASGNVSSITDNGTGSYTVNFTTAMPDANYAGVVSGGFSGNVAGRTTIVNGAPAVDAPTTSAFRIRFTDGLTEDDVTYAQVAFFR
jgi:hypothetical protein